VLLGLREHGKHSGCACLIVDHKRRRSWTKTACCRMGLTYNTYSG
jgi:hypothetical protein